MHHLALPPRSNSDTCLLHDDAAITGFLQQYPRLFGVYRQLQANTRSPTSSGRNTPAASPCSGGIDGVNLNWDALCDIALSPTTLYQPTPISPKIELIPVEISSLDLPTPLILVAAPASPTPEEVRDRDCRAKRRVSTEEECDAACCSNCGTTVASRWRRGPDGKRVCNACGVYYSMYGRVRQVFVGDGTEVEIKRRNRQRAGGKTKQKRRARSESA
ncbi:hypothetical protein BC830DRAFT_1125096 [Chytriomyces sp. MP71]|nr:hypothetical protein BC830DRAFT_1125096 [Chytriomyces sp. MP71]